MTQDEIIELAKKCGAYPASNVDGALLFWSELQVEAFAKLVAEKEREACAKLCEDSVEYAGGTLADAIRTRGQA
jgi:hypothetical protein